MQSYRSRPLPEAEHRTSLCKCPGPCLQASFAIDLAASDVSKPHGSHGPFRANLSPHDP